jgi:hypothetical protein
VVKSNNNDQRRECIARASDFFENVWQFTNGVYLNLLCYESKERVKDAFAKQIWGDAD